MVQVLEAAGVNFKRQFNIHSYRKFFENAGYKMLIITLLMEECPVL